MNVINTDNTMGGRGRGRRGRGRGKIGALGTIQQTVNILPKYLVNEARRPLVNLAPSSSSTTVTPKPARRGYRMISSSGVGKSSGRGRTTDSGTGGRITTSSTSDAQERFVIMAITSGRGEARGEVGMAVMDVQHPHMIICQISDCNSYINTLTKIHIFNPVEILMPDTMCEAGNNLYTAIRTKFEDIDISGISRIHFSDTNGLERIKTHCAPEFASVELVVHEKYYALAATAALMKYIEFIQHVQYMPQSMRIEYQVSQNNTMIDIVSAQSLELVTAHGGEPNFCLFGALDRCSTPMGRRLLRASILYPSCNVDTITARQQCIEEFVNNRSVFTITQPIVRRLYGVSRLLSLGMMTLQGDNVQKAERNLNYILLLKNTIDILPELRAALNTAQAPFLQKVRTDLEDTRFEIMKEKILEIVHEDAMSLMGYSSANMQRCFAIKPKINDLLDIARQAYCELIDDIQSMVLKLGEKYNLPLTLGCNMTYGYHIQMDISKRKFDEQNLPKEFIVLKKQRHLVLMTAEPLVVMGTHCKNACDEIHITSDEIMTEALGEIRNYIGCLFNLNDNIAELDLVLSLAQISSISDYVKPVFESELEVRNSKHPVMDILGIESPTPNDIIASVHYNYHNITGPNMGGKTIYLKQIVLLQIMAQIGCYIPATKAIFRVADRIFCRLGDRDDIEYNASTFMLEMKEAQYILQSITPQSLVVLDELARSTTVEEGASIAWAISKQLLKTRAFTFNATHFLYLLKLVDLYPNATNHYMEALLKDDEIDTLQKRLVYTHKLKQGISTIDHYGITLARSSGLPENIIDDAQQLALELSKNLKFTGTNNMNKHERQVAAQRKINYDTMIAIHKEFSKETVDTDYIYQIMKNIKEIDYTGCDIADPSEQVSVLSTLTTKRTTETQAKDKPMSQEEFKKPRPVQPQMIKGVVSNKENIQPTKRLSVPVSSVSEASQPKIPKLETPLKTSTPLPQPSVNIKPLSERNYDQSIDSPLDSPAKSKKIITDLFSDSDSPFFIPKSQPSVFNSSQNSYLPKLQSQSSAKDKSQAAYSKVDPRYHVPKQYGEIQKLFRQISLSPESKRKKQEYSDTSYEKQSSTATLTDDLVNNPAVSSTSKNTSMITEAKSFKINTPTCKIPEEYRHMRHILKNLPWENKDDQSKPEYSNKASSKTDHFFFTSDVVSRNTNLHPNDRENIEHLLSYKSGSTSSFGDINPLDFCEVLSGPSNLQRMLTDEINQNLIRNDNDLSPTTSQASVDTAAARIRARQKEAEIFKIIEGNAFDEKSFLGSEKTYISIDSE